MAGQLSLPLWAFFSASSVPRCGCYWPDALLGVCLCIYAYINDGMCILINVNAIPQHRINDPIPPYPGQCIILYNTALYGIDFLKDK